MPRRYSPITISDELTPLVRIRRRGFAYLDSTYCLGEVLTATVALDAGATAGTYSAVPGLGDRCSYGRDRHRCKFMGALYR
ncbi:MAG: hypothetical protein IPL33_13005 [Sphingobacteriales bacterium]|nr:hypothetical protein [Sphingobacteriales bacterium]